MRTSPPQLLPIFRSANQAQILAAMCYAKTPITLVEISRETNVPYATVHREVKRLVDAGILLEDRVGQAVIVEFNPDSPLTAPLRQLIEIALGPVHVLKDLLSVIDNIDSAYIFGSWAERASGIAGPPPSDIDLLVIGNPEVGDIYGACRAAGLRLQQTVNPIIMSENQWREETAFNESVKSRQLITLVGELVVKR